MTNVRDADRDSASHAKQLWDDSRDERYCALCIIICPVELAELFRLEPFTGRNS